MSGSSVTAADGRRFRIETEMVDVTSMSRPDPTWTFTDPAGHEHRWFDERGPATDYNPQHRYEVPSIKLVSDGMRVDEFGDEYEVGHHECRQCRAHVEPRRTADTYQQFMPGLRRCYINDEPVLPDEFERQARAAGLLK